MLLSQVLALVACFLGVLIQPSVSQGVCLDNSWVVLCSFFFTDPVNRRNGQPHPFVELELSAAVRV